MCCAGGARDLQGHLLGQGWARTQDGGRRPANPGTAGKSTGGVRVEESGEAGESGEGCQQELGVSEHRISPGPGHGPPEWWP